MAEAPTTEAPTTEQGYVIPAAVQSWSWMPDLDVVAGLPELRYPGSLDTFEQMQLDPQVTSTLSAVTMPLRSTGWWIDPNGADAEVVQLISEDLGLPVRGVDSANVHPGRTRDRFSFHDHLDLALESLAYGHAAFEQVARIEGGRARLRKLAWRPQRSITDWNIARDGGLESIRQREASRPIPVDRLVVYSHRRRGGAWAGRSVLRTSFKFWLLKERMLQVQATSVDRTGVGMPVYTAAPDPDWMTDPEEARAFMEAQKLAGLKLAEQYRSGANVGASIPAGAKLEVVGVSGNLPDPDKVIRYYDEQVARSVLANFLSLGGENSRGSYALGTTFADFFIQSLQAEARWVCDVLTQHVVEDIVDWNWGPDVRAPRVVCDEIGSKHPVTADAIAALINCGALQADVEIERYLRDTYGIAQRGSTYGKGDLDLVKSRVDIFREMVDAGVTFEAAATAAGLGALQPAVSAEQDTVARTLQQIYLAVGTVITQDEAREIANRVGAGLSIPAPKEDQQ